MLVRGADSKFNLYMCFFNRKLAAAWPEIAFRPDILPLSNASMMLNSTIYVIKLFMKVAQKLRKVIM